MKKIFLNLFFTCIFCQMLFAQENFAPYNLYHYNPAAAGVISSFGANFQYNFIQTSYFPGFYNNSHLPNLNIEKRFSKICSAVGINSTLYSIGKDWGKVYRYDVNVSYAYQQKLGKKENAPMIALGLQTGLSKRMEYEPTFGLKKKGNFDIGAMFYLPNNTFYVGFVAVDVLRLKQYDYYQDFSHGYIIMSGYRLKINKNLHFQPNVLLNFHYNYFMYNLNLQCQYKMLEAGFNSYAHNFIGGNLGVCIAKRYSIRAAYNFSTNKSLGGKWINTSMMLAYRFAK